MSDKSNLGGSGKIDPSIFNQTDHFQDESVNVSDIKEDRQGTRDPFSTIMEDDGISDDQDNSSRKFPENPLKGFSLNSLSPKTLGILLAVLVLAVGGYFGYSYLTRDQGASFMQEMENGEAEVEFKYTPEEREMLRNNGYTADDIEKNQALEEDPYALVEKTKEARQEVNKQELKAVYDSASQEFKNLQATTWIGFPDMNKVVFDTTITPTKKYGTFNCDYTKIKPTGVQLFLKLNVPELASSAFMSVSPTMFNSLGDSGNIVVEIDYYQYESGDIVITTMSEKDITKTY